MDVTRRNFMKATGAAAGVMIATGWSPFAYAQNEKVRLAVIGTGSQNRFHIENGIAGNPQIEVVAMTDCLRPSLAAGVASLCGTDQAKRDAIMKHLYIDYREMLSKEKDNIDAVLIATPYKTHYQIVMDCLDAGKYVFCEKTMSDTYERCRNIVTKCHETGKFVQCGHQRRYNPEYIHAIEGFKDDMNPRLGRVQYIEGQWHRNGDWRRPLPKMKDGSDYVLTPAEAAFIPDLRKMVNWRIYEEYSAGLISELATHHIEVVNWFMGTPPARVWATGGTDYWKDDRDTYDNVILVFEYDVNRRNRGFVTTSPKTSAEQMDMVAMQKPYTVRFQWTGTLQSSHKGESLLMLGDKGSYELRERAGKDGTLGSDPTARGCSYQAEPTKLWLDPATGQPTEDEKIKAYIKQSGQTQKYTKLIDHDVIKFETELDPSVFDKVADVNQFEAFARHIKTGGVPRTNQMCGLMASICDIAAHEASRSKQVVEIKPEIYKFDFETPDPFLIKDPVA